MNKQQLANKIWASANKMRSKIEANEYKDYILGFIFYKFLSENIVKFCKDNDFSDEDLVQLKEEDTEIVKWVQEDRGYFIAYEHLYSTWIDKKFDFQISNVRDALSAFTRLISPTHKKVFAGIFETLQTGLKKLGTSDAEQTRAVRDLLALIKDIPMNGKQDYDVLGFIYEYLISQFAANAGKKAGEFYTPHEVSLLMSEIVALHLKDRERIEIYDPTSGSGSLLINIGKSVAKHLKAEDSIMYYAQELKQNTYNLTRMNLVMRGIIPDNIVTRNGDTLKDDWPYFDENDKEGTYNPLFVDAVVSNPPYSQPWAPPRKPKSGEQGENDPRFDYGIAPKGKADYAFLLHDLYHLKSDGIMAIVLPHGVLFRGDAGDGTPDNKGDLSEGTIRRELIENDHIDTIIGLPADIFFGTGIPTIVMVLRKHRERNDVLIIDASKGFKKEGKKNKLRASDIKRIVDTYEQRADVPKFARVVSKDEIRSNGYNLNLPRYVNSSDDLETWDLSATIFGEIPKNDLESFSSYWTAFPSLYDDLFAKTETPYTAFVVNNVRQFIKEHTDVRNFVSNYKMAFGDFNTLLRQRLLDNMPSLKIAAEESSLTKQMFQRLAPLPLVDRFEAYQLFADKWEVIAQDLEIIQSEGFSATKVVDPNMVVKKKDDTEYEIQDGWVGRILPFELVQTTHLKEEFQALADKKARYDEIDGDIDTCLGEMSEEDKDAIVNEDGKLLPKSVEEKLSEALLQVETPAILVLQEYLVFTKKKDKQAFIASHSEVEWSAMATGKDGTYPAKSVNKYIADLRSTYEFEDGSYESILIKISNLLFESKRLKSEIKQDSLALHEHTKSVIETELSDEDVMELLSMKWIDSLCDHINKLPYTVVDDFIEKVMALHKKYDTTLISIDNDIKEASRELTQMFDDLTGNEYDMKALAELKTILCNE